MVRIARPHRRGPLGAWADRQKATSLAEREISTFTAFQEAAAPKEEAIRVPFTRWAEDVPEPKTGTLDWDRFPYQPAIYRAFGEDVQDVVVVKATQVGMSALTLRWAIWLPDQRGYTTLYLFPKLTDVHDFADARVKPMIDGSEYLSRRVGSVNNKGQREVGEGRVYFRGTESKTGLQSVDADALVLDERDFLNAEFMPDAFRRISGPLSAGLVRRIGTPTWPEYGIAKDYSESDQRKWLVKCGACREGHQEITFPDNVDATKYRIVCRRCAKPLDVATGEWVAAKPGRDIPGFHVTRLLVPGQDERAQKRVKDIVLASLATDPTLVQSFWNFDLGLPYEGEEGGLTLEQIAAAVSAGGGSTTVPGYAGSNPVTLGMDVASARSCHVRVSELLPNGKKRALWIGEIGGPDGPGQDGMGPFDTVALLMDRYQVNMACIDAQPEHRLARALAERFPGRIYLVYFSGQQQRDVLVPNVEQRFVTVRRTESLDAAIELIRTQRNLLPIDYPPDYPNHLRSEKRRVVKDELGRKAVEYVKTGDDDYLMAEVYDVVAEAMLLIQMEVDDAQAQVFTPLDEMLEFQRSSVNDLGDAEMRFGPDEGGLGPGDHEEEWPPEEV